MSDPTSRPQAGDADRYRTLLREEVAHTVGGTEEIDDELRYLCAALSAAE